MRFVLLHFGQRKSVFSPLAALFRCGCGCARTGFPKTSNASGWGTQRFRGVKIKLGRGDKWTRKAGDDRDIAIIHAARAAMGPNTLLMADPNYGYKGQFDAAWRLLDETRTANLHWMEEIFPETVPDYQDLREKMVEGGIKTLLAADEHIRDIHAFEPYLEPKPLMDVLQMDIRQGGFLDNLAVARMPAAAGAVAIHYASLNRRSGHPDGGERPFHLRRASY